MSPESPTIQHEPDKEWHIEEVLKVLGNLCCSLVSLASS